MDYENEILLAHFETKDCGKQYSTFRWIKKNIESSFTSEHIGGCKELIKYFKKLHNNEHLVDELETILYRRSLMILIP
jgi:hypothetical protein